MHQGMVISTMYDSRSSPVTRSLGPLAPLSSKHTGAAVVRLACRRGSLGLMVGSYKSQTIVCGLSLWNEVVERMTRASRTPGSRRTSRRTVLTT